MCSYICEYDGYTTAEMASIDSFIVDEKVDFFFVGWNQVLYVYATILSIELPTTFGT